MTDLTLDQMKAICDWIGVEYEIREYVEHPTTCYDLSSKELIGSVRKWVWTLGQPPSRKLIDVIEDKWLMVDEVRAYQKFYAEDEKKFGHGYMVTLTDRPEYNGDTRWAALLQVLQATVPELSNNKAKQT